MNSEDAGLEQPLVVSELALARLAACRREYASAEPFPHLVVDDVLERDVARRAAESFPPPDERGWIHYAHFNERKLGLNERSRMPALHRAIIDELCSSRFVAMLRELTGIADLVADPDLEGGGLHQVERGGFLNLHADYGAHPHRRRWRRRVNVILYLNDEWRPEWGGDLELWSASLSRCERRVAPLLNRVVVFNTDARSFHGHPDPLVCPRGITRKSIALYYFTVEVAELPAASTDYRARPDDGSKRALIAADRLAVGAYHRAKRLFGFDDRFVSRVLRLFTRR